MFENVAIRLTQIFDQLRRRGKLSEGDVDTALREVRLALLEADVHYGVVRDLLARIRERAVGAQVSRALNPAQQVIKIVYEELIGTLGEPVPLSLSGPRPRVMMLVGLQGSGKTTAAGKLARFLQASGERVLLVSGDPYRPAAGEQLRQLASQLAVDMYVGQGESPADEARRALDKARDGGYSVLILDTAGRSQIDEAMMVELADLDATIRPAETLLVLDAMLGQEAVNIAKGFQGRLPLTGLVMTKVDGDARGGAVISVRSVASIPLKFLGTGEKLDDLEKYDPERLASRILGMGDVIGLIEKAESAMDSATAQRQAAKLLKGEFDLEDWLDQMRQVRKLGSLTQITEMLPGRLGEAARQADPVEMERGFQASAAIIQSMTRSERRNPEILNASRRRRIAVGSGTSVEAVNRLLKQFREAQKMIKAMKTAGPRGGLPKIFG